jgi:V8-like Glu-specific endopeptidase
LAFEHDCSTLGGNSGSCVLSVGGHVVVGLHYAGLDVDAAGRGSANVALALSRLGSHPGAQLLRAGRV